MSLISVRNFVSPLTNTTHIVSILLVTIVFALFRLQGGAVNIDFSSSGAKRNYEAPSNSSLPPSNAESLDSLLHESTSNSQPKSFTITQTAPKTLDKGKITISEDEDLIGQMIGKNEPKVNKPSNDRKNGSVEKAGGLDDIEKIVGIR